MAKIPTYNSKLSAQPTFTKPVAPRGLAENINLVANYANNIADKNAEIKGYEQGFKQQSESVGNNFVTSNAPKTSFAGSAFNKGAQAAYMSNFKTKAENELNDFAVQHQYEPEKYKKKFEAYKLKNLSNVPSTLLPLTTQWLDSIGNRLNRGVINNKLTYDKQTAVVDITNRFELLLPQLSDSIKTNGFDTNTSINTYAELLSSITALEDDNVNPVTINNLKLKLKDEVINSSVIDAFNKSDDKQSFIAQVQKGEIKEILEDVNETYKVKGFEFNTSLSAVDSSNLSSKLNTILKYDMTEKKVERQSFVNDFNTWYSTSISGLDAGETPNLETAKNLYFDDVKINEMQNKMDIITSIAPSINESRFGTVSESQNLLTEAKAEYSIILQAPAGTERNKDIEIAEAKVDAITKNVKFKQDAIAEGNPYKILSLQGITYNFDNEQEITKAHELVKSNVGISADRLLIMPKSNLETYKGELETADTQASALAIVAKQKAQFGKYTEKFLLDAELDDGYRVVFDMVEKEPATAGTIWQSLKDKEQNKNALKDSRTTFADDEKAFATSFKENFGSSFRGNEDLYNDIYEGAYAYYLKNLATIGDNEKAINNTIGKFGNEGGIYQYVDINEQSVFVPQNLDAVAIKNNVEDMLENPHRYSITSSANFTLQDVVENKDEYTVVVEGGSAKIIQNSNILFAAEIYQKLPSGSKQFVYSDVMVNTDDAYNTETSIIDFDETWSYDKKQNLNKNINSQIKDTKIVEVPTSTFEVGTATVNTSTFEKITQLKEIVYKETADADGMNYVDVFSGDIGVTGRDMQNLNAISLYMKDGELKPYILDYLSEFDYLSKLKNLEVQKEVLEKWKVKEQRIRTTSNVESVLMTPLQSLTDIVRSISVEQDNKTYESGEAPLVP